MRPFTRAALLWLALLAACGGGTTTLPGASPRSSRPSPPRPVPWGGGRAARQALVDVADEAPRDRQPLLGATLGVMRCSLDADGILDQSLEP
jgi:hypothetical protein